MGLIEKKKDESKVTKKQEPNFELAKNEYEFLFEIIKTTSFKGESVELLYNIVSKLQNQYVNKYRK